MLQGSLAHGVGQGFVNGRERPFGVCHYSLGIGHPLLMGLGRTYRLRDASPRRLGQQLAYLHPTGHIAFETSGVEGIWYRLG